MNIAERIYDLQKTLQQPANDWVKRLLEKQASQANRYSLKHQGLVLQLEQHNLLMNLWEKSRTHKELLHRAFKSASFQIMLDIHGEVLEIGQKQGEIIAVALTILADGAQEAYKYYKREYEEYHPGQPDGDKDDKAEAEWYN